MDIIKLGRKSKSEIAKCKRLSEKSHKYSHCRQEKCDDDDGDGDDDKDGDDDPKMVQYNKICCYIDLSNPQILLSPKRLCRTTRFVVLLAIFW